MSRHRTIVILCVGLVLSLLIVGGYKAYRLAEFAVSSVVMYGAARQTQLGLESGQIDYTMEPMWLGELKRDAVRPSIAVLSSLVRLDLSLRQRFGEGLASRPFPLESHHMDSVRIEGDIAWLGPPGLETRMIWRERRWNVDPAPHVVRFGNIEAPEKLVAELEWLAKRIRDGEFHTLDEAREACDDLLTSYGLGKDVPS